MMGIDPLIWRLDEKRRMKRLRNLSNFSGSPGPPSIVYVAEHRYTAFRLANWSRRLIKDHDYVGDL